MKPTHPGTYPRIYSSGRLRLFWLRQGFRLGLAGAAQKQIRYRSMVQVWLPLNCSYLGSLYFGSLLAGFSSNSRRYPKNCSFEHPVSLRVCTLSEMKAGLSCLLCSKYYPISTPVRTLRRDRVVAGTRGPGWKESGERSSFSV